MAKPYYRGASGALVVYDVTQQDSFEGVKRWLGVSSDATSSASQPQEDTSRLQPLLCALPRAPPMAMGLAAAVDRCVFEEF